ncbi:unnamed protein product, partial [Iphiclides podalirius]
MWRCCQLSRVSPREGVRGPPRPTSLSRVFIFGRGGRRLAARATVAMATRPAARSPDDARKRPRERSPPKMRRARDTRAEQS